MEPQALDARVCRGCIEGPFDVLKWLTRCSIREDEFAESDVSLLLNKDVEQETVDRDDPRLPALGLAQPDRSRGQVHLAPSQSQNLASPHSGIQSDLNDREETLRAVLQECIRAELLFIESM